MAANSMFRKVLFGGLNKADVEEYIQTLENEIDSIKVLHQKEKGDLMRRLDAANEEVLAAQEKEREAREALEENQSEGRPETAENEEEAARLQGEVEELKRLLEETRAEKTRWEERAAQEEGRREALEAETAARGGSGAEGTGMRDAAERQKAEETYRRLSQENEELKRQLEEQQAFRGQRDGEEPDGDFFDYATVKKILEDANRNARLIEEEARERADKLVEETKQEMERRKKDAAARMSAELEEKGIQLIAAKYKIEQYARELCNVHEGMYSVYNRMNKLIDEMPVRLDDYWEGEHYRMLEDERKGIAQQEETEEEEQP